jgi:predicted histone-like DNA-binding protein
MYDEKKQKMRIKYRDTFGGDANKLDAIHDYLAEVNKKWGLVRGESVSATNAQHIPRDEWYRQLQAESRELEIANGKLELDIRRKENAVKGLKTMIENLTHQKSEVENKIHEVEKLLEQQNGEHSEFSKELERLKSQLSTLEFKLTDKREKLSAADEALAEFRAMTRAQKSEAETLRVVQEQTSRTLQTYAQASILAGSFQELLTMSSRICANVPEAKKMAENTIIEDMCEESTLSKADVVAVVAGLSKHLLKNLQEGYTVKIDSLGTFSTSVKSSTVDNAEDVHPKDVSFSKINYLPEVKMLESFRAVSFQKVETKEEAKVSKPRGRKPIRRK